MLKAPRVQLASLAIICILSVFSWWYANPPNRVLHSKKQDYSEKKNPAAGFRPSEARLKDVRNSTLGFQKVFVINLPERTDKLDEFALVSSLTGFNTDVIDGVKGETVLNKTLPALEGLPNNERHRNNRVGCWRAHMNFARTIINQRLSSALVLEDDADWDTHIKDQLGLFAQGSQYVTGVSVRHRPHSPYGDDWDLIWLGHCSTQIMPDDERRFIIENDVTTPPPSRRVNFAGIPDMAREGYENSTRVVFRANNGVCLYAYALSYRGARKLLRGQLTRKEFAPIDLAIGHMCRDDPEFKCIGVFPQIIDSHKAAGSLDRDSDISDFSEAETRQSGYTFNIVHSTRLNMDHLLAGETNQIERQWPEDPKIIGPPRTKPIGRVLD